jgi:hypothetical protein
MTTVLKTCDGLMKYKKLNHRSMCFREVLIRSPMHRHCDFSAGRFGTNDIVEVFEPFGDLNSNLYLQLRFVYELSLIDSRIDNGYPFNNGLCYGVCDPMEPLNN